MDNFYIAINDYFKETPHNAFYTAIGGRFSYGEGKQGGEYPYAVYFGLPSTNEDTFTETIDGISFQINIVSNSTSPIPAMQALTYCKNLFEWATIEIPGSDDVKLQRELEVPPWKNGDEWIASIEFITLLKAED